MNLYYWKYEKAPFARDKASRIVDNGKWKRKAKVSIFEYWVRKFLKGVYFIKIMSSKNIYLNRFALVTSYRCTLNCEGCGQHTPFIAQMPKEKRTINMEQVKDSMNRLLSAVGGIKIIGLANGEAFINENLLEAIEYIGNCNQILQLNLPTNGTVVPDMEILLAMKKYGVTATITKYPCVPWEKIEKLKTAFDQLGIQYSVYEDREWFDMGKFDDLTCTVNELKEKYRNCEKYWILINNTELWKCVIYSTAVFCGHEEKRREEYVDLSKSSIAQIKRHIMQVANQPYLDVCARCHGMYGKDAITIPAGKQIKRL